MVGEPPRSFLGVPIILGDRTLGVVSVQSLERFNAYSERDEYILSMIADQAAVAIANAQRYAAVGQQLQQRIAELEALAETVRDLNATLDTDIILNRLVERTCVTTGADAGMVCLVVDEGRELVAKALRGYPEDRFWGRNMFLLSAEYRRPLAQALTGVLFVDVGDAWNAPEAYQIADPTLQNRFRQHNSFEPQAAAGIGLRVTTPIGPIRLDYGYGSEGGRLHFSIGHSF